MLASATGSAAAGDPSPPSFDCKAARSVVERLICSDFELAAWDRVLDEQYQLAMLETKDQEALRSAQRRWLAQRNRCSDWQCVQEAYEKRFVELRRAVTCVRDLGTRACVAEQTLGIPETIDGLRVLRTREECRSGKNTPYDGAIRFGGQDVAIQIQADCIEARIFDPCQDAGGTWGLAQCGWANLEVAERRVRRAQDALLQLPGLDTQSLNRAISSSAVRWDHHRNQYCQQRNRRELAGPVWPFKPLPPPDDDGGEPASFCYRRLTEKRAHDLEDLLHALRTPDNRLEQARLFEYLANDPSASAAQPGR